MGQTQKPSMRGGSLGQIGYWDWVEGIDSDRQKENSKPCIRCMCKPLPSIKEQRSETEYFHHFWNVFSQIRSIHVSIILLCQIPATFFFKVNTNSNPINSAALGFPTRLPKVGKGMIRRMPLLHTRRNSCRMMSSWPFSPRLLQIMFDFVSASTHDQRVFTINKSCKYS